MIHRSADLLTQACALFFLLPRPFFDDGVEPGAEKEEVEGGVHPEQGDDDDGEAAVDAVKAEAGHRPGVDAGEDEPGRRGEGRAGQLLSIPQLLLWHVGEEKRVQRRHDEEEHDLPAPDEDRPQARPLGDEPDGI